MIRSTLLALSVLTLASAPAMAATSPNPMTRAIPAQPARKVANATTARRATPATPARPAVRTAAARPRGKSGLVTATLANGKKVTYNCNLAGNKTKTACKG